jgi:hypothetical protein
MLDAALSLGVLHRHAAPDVLGAQAISIAVVKILLHQGATLSKNLEYMPVSVVHCIKYTINKALGNIFVEEVAHRIYKNHSRPTPLLRLINPVWPKLQVEPVFEWMASNAPKALGKAFSVAVVTAATYLRAAGDWVPSSISPLD